MKFVFGFIGWIVGMFLYFVVGETSPFLGAFFIIGGILLGLYIGRRTEEDMENQRRAREDYERKRKQEEYNRQKKLQKKAEAQSLARKYPEATRHYLKMHWGITKAVITDYDITDDKVETLLGHKYSYESDEKTYNAAYKAKLEAERQEKIRRDEAVKEAEKQARVAALRARLLAGRRGTMIRGLDEDQAKRDFLLTKVSQWNTYESDEKTYNAAYKAKLEAERQEKIRRDEAVKEAEKQARVAALRARLLAGRRGTMIRGLAEEQAKRDFLLTKVSQWNMLGGSFRYNYLLNYYPTTCDFEASEAEWADRWTVWNFKNTPGKTSSFAHEHTLDIVIPQIKSKLVATFGTEALKYLTFVCIPASSALKTQARYEEFSQRLCSETGMMNAYRHMQVIASSQEKKFGGSGISADNVSFNNSFFRSKYVLLFDDVITKGDSMLRFKRKMEELGAIVVGGFSIGKTTHIR